MKKFLQNLQVALSDLVFGRKLPPQPKRVITVDIQKELSEQLEPQSESPLESLPQNEPNQLQKNLSNEKIVVLPFNDPQLLSHFSETNREVVYKYLLKRLRKAVKFNMDGIVIFRFNNPQKIASIGRDKYESQLNTMMDWFVETEDYESAGECRDLIRQLTTNKVDQSM